MDYKIEKNDGKIAVIFDFLEEKITGKIQDITEDEEGLGLLDNWETIIWHFFNESGQADLLESAELEPWGKNDCFYAFFDDTPENEAKAAKYAETVCAIAADEEKLFSFVRENLVSKEED